MMIAARNSFLMSGAKLPYDAEIEYLESTGTQWIDTEYIPTNTTGLNALIEYTATDGGVAAGTMISGNRYVAPYYATNGKWYIGWGGAEPSVATPPPAGHVEIAINYLNNRTASVDDLIITKSLGNISGTFPPITVFRRNFASVYSYFTGRVYSLKISDRLTLVRDFIPVRIGQTGYLYDRVTKRLFGNKDTGSFVLGPDK